MYRVLKRYGVKLVKVNLDDGPKLQQRFNVMAIPTLMVPRRGRWRRSGPVRLGRGDPRELAGLGMRSLRPAGKL